MIWYIYNYLNSLDVLILFYFILSFISEGGTLPNTNTISKPINELEKMLDTNKDTTGKRLSTFIVNLSQNYVHGSFTTCLSIKQTSAV